MTAPITYAAPEGIAADKTASTFDRIKAYRAQDHRLADGTKIVPTIETCRLVFAAAELSEQLGFSCPLAVSADSYTVKG